MLKVSYCSCRKRCRDRRARPCKNNYYQWQLSLRFYTQPPCSLSSAECRFAPATKQATRIYHLITTTPTTTPTTTTPPTTTPTTILHEQQKLILLVAAGVCGGVVVYVCYVGCELRVTRCLRAMIVWLLPCALLPREERAPVSYTAAQAYIARGGWCLWWCSGLCVLWWL